ncbi:S-adenosylmethionine-dependent methyltransferase-like protein [Truncatella angustata]|uniref:S-adenosylmethionine-dependent methyltransferase-like protein n=1 Tax=Truncatella angustata TaxID=152316 RepID=A0A9P9A269_9PEZI|nr:S-adenosylmethionine-dependent methyltransferase-like protein [Truncatella angustata]KAH6657876.1 S-adenosylmethionine-dependent methyltransferase-like protein [Truncatella angustata]KAH8196302.1 hypothetical protein TruAng_009550 [Truncatella angustata]
MDQPKSYVSPLDFPQVWQKPSSEAIIACLKRLHVEPPIWNPSTSQRVILEDHENSARFRKEVAAYLASFIKSDLRWISADEEKEAIWDEASRRLSERCGRAGMGEITRRWPFASEAYPAFELIVREPPITGDALGLKTWGSSYFLARLLDKIAEQSLSHLLIEHNSLPDVLELGSGTGLCGMAAAAIWKTRVALSDLPNIVPNLSHNIEKNSEVIEALGGQVEAGDLTWGGHLEDNDDMFTKKNQFKIILIADPIYDDNHPALLASAVHDHLAQTEDARVVAMVPMRDDTTRRLLAKFRDFLADGKRPLACLEEHRLMGQDDWGEDEEPPQIECWWGVFGSNN